MKDLMIWSLMSDLKSKKWIATGPGGSRTYILQFSCLEDCFWLCNSWLTFRWFHFVIPSPLSLFFLRLVWINWTNWHDIWWPLSSYYYNNIMAEVSSSAECQYYSQAICIFRKSFKAPARANSSITPFLTIRPWRVLMNITLLLVEFSKNKD